MREGGELLSNRPAGLPYGENRVEAQAGNDGAQGGTSLASQLADAAIARDLVEKRSTGLRGAQFVTENGTLTENAWSRQCGSCSAVLPPEGGSAVAPCFRLSENRRSSKPCSRHGTLAGTQAARRKTDGSPTNLFERGSHFYADTSKSLPDNQVKAGTAYAPADQPAQAARPEVSGTRGTCQGSRRYDANLPLMPHSDAMRDPTQGSRAATAAPARIDVVCARQQHALREEGRFINTCDVSAREPTRKALSVKTRSIAGELTASTVRYSGLTKRTGSLPVSLSVQKSLSTAALLSSKRRAADSASGGVAAHITDPTVYSRLPPEVWVYKALECSPVSAVHKDSDECTQRRATLGGYRGVVAGDCRSHTSVEAVSPARQWRRSSVVEQRLVFPLENPGGHHQADFLSRCIPTLLEVNNVPTLFSLRHCPAAVESTTTAFSLQSSTSANSPDATAAWTPRKSAEGRPALKPSLLLSGKDRVSRRVTVSEDDPAAGRAANASADTSPIPPTNARDAPPNHRLSKGLQAVHDALVSSEWWAGLMNVVDVTLSELCRQLKTFAPFHAKCLDETHQLLIDYADMHQQVQARQLAQLRTSLLEAHAEHAALRKEIVSLGHKRGTLESKAREAGELRRVLDIHAHLFSLQEMEALAAQQMEEEAVRADFQWHQLSEVVEAVKLGKDKNLSTDVWTSNTSDERQSNESTQQSHQLLSTVLPTIVTLVPHETIVRGTLDSSVHVRLLRILIPPGRWNLGIAVTCSQPLDISLLLLLAVKHTRSRETKEDRSSSEQTALPFGTGDVQRNSPSGLETFDSTQCELMHSSALQMTSSVAPSCPHHTNPISHQEKASYSHGEGSDAPDFYSGELQIDSFASFRISPDQPQILQVATPAAGSPGGGWVLVRLQGAFSTKRNLAQKAVEACRNSFMASAISSTTRDTLAELQSPPQSLSSSLPSYPADGDSETKKLQTVRARYKPSHAQQDDDVETGQNKLGRSAGSGENPDKKQNMSFNVAQDGLASAAALCIKEELKFSLTVHSVFLHRSVRPREQHACSGNSEQVVHAQTNTCQLQHLGVPTGESSAGLIENGPGNLVNSAHIPSSAGPDVKRAVWGRPRCQYSWPPRLILKQDANTQTLSSKLLRGFVRRLHEGPRPPPIPQFCACDSDLLESSSSHVEQNHRCAYTQTDDVVVSPYLQADLELTPTHTGETLGQQKDLKQTTSSFAKPAGTPARDSPVNRTSGCEHERLNRASKGALDERKCAYYYAPSYPIFKLLLDETPIALGDFTTLLHQKHVLRDATGVPTAFKGSSFTRWPPRLLAETVWVILLQHARTHAPREARALEPHQQLMHSGCLHTNDELHASANPPASCNLAGSPVLPANTAGATAALGGIAASKPGRSHASDSCGGPKDASGQDDSLQASPASIGQEENSTEALCGINANSLAAFAFKYFLSRLDVAFLAHNVLHSFLLSILYWAPALEAISVRPQKSEEVVSLHRPLHFSGSITADRTTRTSKDDDTLGSIDRAQDGKHSAETVKEKEVKLATSNSRGFMPWFAVRLFARITDLLSSPRDTQLFRGSLDDFVRLALQAFLDELTVNPVSRRLRGRSSFKAAVAGELNRGSVSCDAALSRLPSDKSAQRRKSSEVSRSCGYDRVSLLLIPPSHMQVPTELCLALTYRAATRIGVRIFSEEGTSEYRTAVLQAISDAKEAAEASIRLSKGLSRWMQSDTTSPRGGQKDTARRRTHLGRSSVVHHASNRESFSRKGERSSLPFSGEGEGKMFTSGPPEYDDLDSRRWGRDSSNDALWELPMSADLLLQILTQQWEVLYVHLQQAMELVLDETEAKLLEPLTSLSGFSSFIRSLNSSGTSTPEDVLHLYYQTLSTTSSRLQPFCAPLPSTALSAILLYRSRLTDFPLPFPPSPFLTLAPLVEVEEGSAVPPSPSARSRVRTDTQALPLWPIHTRSSLSSTNVMSKTTSQRREVDPLSDATPTPFALSVISSASHEFRLAEFIVDGLLAFVRSEAGICVKDALKQGNQCTGMSASVAGTVPVWEGKLFERHTHVSLSQKTGDEQRLFSRGLSSESVGAAVNVEDSVPVNSSKYSVFKSASLRSLRTPSGIVSPCVGEKFATDVDETETVRHDAQTRQRARVKEDIQMQARADTFSSTRYYGTSDVFGSGCGRQQRVSDNGRQVESEGWTPLGGRTSVDPSSPTTGVNGVSACTTVGLNCRSSGAAVGAHSFYRHQEAGTSARIVLNTQASGPTRRLCSSASFGYMGAVLDKKVALETAKEVETAALTEGVAVLPLLERLQFFLKTLLEIFGRTDLPEPSADETSAEPQKNSAASQDRVYLLRTLEGFTPSLGRLSSPRRTDEEYTQILSSADVATAQILLQCIWNAIFKIAAFMAEEREQRRTLGHLVGLQRVKCQAAAKEALGELARIYRDQVDRLLILSLGSEGVSAILEQPGLREELLQMHQRVLNLEQQQQRLQEVFTAAAGAAAAGELQQFDERRSREEQVSKDPAIADGAPAATVQQWDEPQSEEHRGP